MSVGGTLVIVGTLVVARLVLRSTPAAVAALCALLVAFEFLGLRVNRPGALSVMVLLGIVLVLAAVTLWVFWKSGALALTISMAVSILLESVPWTFDQSRWYAWRTWFSLACVAGLAIWGLRCVLGRQSVLPRAIVDD